MKTKTVFLLLLSLLILSKIVIICITYDGIQQQNTYDFKSYQKTSKTLIGYDTDIVKRDWQYPPLYSILIIPTLFYDTMGYLIFLNIILIAISYYFLFKFCNLFISEHKSCIISFVTLFFNFAFAFPHLGMPISLSAMLFIIFSYNLYKIKSNFIYCSISFVLLLLTKYLFIALIPFIIYWIMINYDNNYIKKTISYFIIPIVFSIVWFTRNALLYGLHVSGIIGGYEVIHINLYLIPEKIMFLFIDTYARSVMLVYLIFIISYIAIYHFQFMYNKRYLNRTELLFNNILLMYFVVTFFMFGFLYEVDGFRIRYFIYQTPIIMSIGLINMIMIYKLTK